MGSRLDGMKSLKSGISFAKSYISLPFYINFQLPVPKQNCICMLNLTYAKLNAKASNMKIRFAVVFIRH